MPVYHRGWFSWRGEHLCKHWLILGSGDNAPKEPHGHCFLLLPEGSDSNPTDFLEYMHPVATSTICFLTTTIPGIIKPSPGPYVENAADEKEDYYYNSLRFHHAVQSVFYAQLERLQTHIGKIYSAVFICRCSRVVSSGISSLGSTIRVSLTGFMQMLL